MEILRYIDHIIEVLTDVTCFTVFLLLTFLVRSCFSYSSPSVFSNLDNTQTHTVTNTHSSTHTCLNHYLCYRLQLTVTVLCLNLTKVMDEGNYGVTFDGLRQFSTQEPPD
jgi:hypothetical protein